MLDGRKLVVFDSISSAKHGFSVKTAAVVAVESSVAGVSLLGWPAGRAGFVAEIRRAA
jgi:hypothetical protein